MISSIYLFIFLRSKDETHDVDEGGEKDDDDGEDAHQRAVEPGLDDPLGQVLQRPREHLTTTHTHTHTHVIGV